VSDARTAKPSWNDVKAGLSNFDRAGLLGLLKDLHAASRDNQAFLHARLGLGADPLKPYKTVISRWVCPDVFKNQHVSVARAKKAMSDYKKAVGRPQGMAELSVFYCEEAFNLLSVCGMEDESYFAALVRMFGHALMLVAILPQAERATFLDRLDRLRSSANDIGWGVKEELESLWLEAIPGTEE
jgi:hypothetical protein